MIPNKIMNMSKNNFYKKIIAFDLDGVICKTNKKKNYKKSIPIKKNIKIINKLYKSNYKIVIFTARYMGRSNENIVVATKKAKIITMKQLKKWKVFFHSLKFGKPSYDLFVDDKAYGFDKNWAKKIHKLVLKI